MSELKPCPFCWGESSIHSNRDWHSIKVTHKEDCILDNFGVTLAYANSTGQRELLVSDWNTRTSPEVEFKDLTVALDIPDFGKIAHDNENIFLQRTGCNLISLPNEMYPLYKFMRTQQVEIERLIGLERSTYDTCKKLCTEAYEIRDQLQSRVKKLESYFSEIIDLNNDYEKSRSEGQYHAPWQFALEVAHEALDTPTAQEN